MISGQPGVLRAVERGGQPHIKWGARASGGPGGLPEREEKQKKKEKKMKRKRKEKENKGEKIEEKRKRKKKLIEI